MRNLLLLPLVVTAACASAPKPRAIPNQPGRPVVPSTALDTCIDGAGNRLYSGNAEGLIVARRLDDGRVLWTSKDTGRVAHCDTQAVLISSIDDGVLLIRGLDPNNGDQKFSQSAKVPTWVSRSNIGVDAWTDQQGYGVSWTALTYWQGGYPPSPEEEREAHREAKGAFVFHPGSGSSTSPVGGRPKFKQRPVPEALLPRFPDASASITWDQEHVIFLGRQESHVVNIKSEAIAKVGFRLHSGSGLTYVTRGGKIVDVRAHNEREDSHEFSVVDVRVWNWQGEELWKAELRRVREPEPVP